MEGLLEACRFPSSLLAFLSVHGALATLQQESSGTCLAGVIVLRYQHLFVCMMCLSVPESINVHAAAVIGQCRLHVGKRGLETACHFKRLECRELCACQRNASVRLGL